MDLVKFSADIEHWDLQVGPEFACSFLYTNLIYSKAFVRQMCQISSWRFMLFGFSIKNKKCEGQRTWFTHTQE